MATSRPVEPACPVNYFGRGVNYQLPSDERSATWFDEQWQAWERAHPDDATGEKAWAEYLSDLHDWQFDNLNEVLEAKPEPTSALLGTAPSRISATEASLLPNIPTPAPRQGKRKGKEKPPLPTVELPPTLIAKWVSEAQEEERQRRIRSVQGMITNHNPHQVRLTVDKVVYEKFYKFCKKNGISMSSLIDKFMDYIK